MPQVRELTDSDFRPSRPINPDRASPAAGSRRLWKQRSETRGRAAKNGSNAARKSDADAKLRRPPSRRSDFTPPFVTFVSSSSSFGCPGKPFSTGGRLANTVGFRGTGFRGTPNCFGGHRFGGHQTQLLTRTECFGGHQTQLLTRTESHRPSVNDPPYLRSSKRASRASKRVLASSKAGSSALRVSR
jgi:hypothetical protein